MTLNETEKRRLLRTLREDPDFLAEVRSLILPAELVQLPQRFAEFAAQVMDFIQRQEELNTQFLAFMQRQEEFNAEVRTFMVEQEEFNTEVRTFMVEQEEFNTEVRTFMVEQEEFNTEVRTFMVDQKEFNQQQEEFNTEVRTFMVEQKEFNRRQEETNQSVNTRLQQITDDLGDLKGHVAGRIAREMADDIAEHLGFEIVQLLNGQDLRQMLRRQQPGDLPPGVRRSFYHADVVARVIGPDGKEGFMTAEASYTADRRDSDRALRNAALLTRFTGELATPVIASLRNDYEVAELVEQQAILWYQFEARDLTPA